MALELTINSKVRPLRELVSSRVGDELVLLNLKTGIYFGLNPTGTLIWEHLNPDKSLAATRDLVVAEYAVEPEACERDLLGLVRHLAEQGLVEVL